MNSPSHLDAARFPEARRRVFLAALWLAVALIAIKASYLGVPREAGDLRSLAAISYSDVLLAAGIWAIARLAIALAAGRPRVLRALEIATVGGSAFICFYAAVNVAIFESLRGFLSYPLLALVDDVGMLRSSVTARLTVWVVMGTLGAPLAYSSLVSFGMRRSVEPRASSWRSLIVGALAIIWVAVGHRTFVSVWETRDDKRVADSAAVELAESWWQTIGNGPLVQLTDRVPPDALADFQAIDPHDLPRDARPTPARNDVQQAAIERSPNVTLIVLESVAARWTSLDGGTAGTTPVLEAQAGRGVVFRNFYAHIGRSSNSLASLLLSAYPKLDFSEITQEYPRLPGTSLASVMHDRGYRTAFTTPSDLSWAGWSTFLAGRGFDVVRDFHAMPCSEPISSWGVEDRCMVDDMIRWISEDRQRPFFMMAWSQQTHHPYEPSPGAPVLTFKHDRTPDDWDLDRYLNVLHETDSRLGDLFASIRRAGIEDNTIVVVTGDHGQAFGFPHASYMQGSTIYEEDVRVPLMIAYPSIYKTRTLSDTIGGHIDIAPTITDLLGWPAAPDWQGRSLFEPHRAPRAYFYVAESEFRLGVREGDWKYIVDLRDGTEELFNLTRDPSEQRSVAQEEPERSRRLRQRIAGWMEANRRQYGQTKQ